jgi:hypothetical protein
MTTTLKPVYSGAASAFTWTLASLASGSYRQNTAVDNSTNLYDEIIVNGKIKTGSSGVSATGTVSIYAYAYDGSNYSKGASGTDGSFTPDNAANLVPVCTIAAVSNATTYFFDFQLVAGSGWIMLPQKWGLIILNSSGATFDATGGNFLAEWQGIQFQGV